MIQAARQSPMDTGLLKPRGEFTEDSAGSGAESRPRKRFQRAHSENEDPLRRNMAASSTRGNVTHNDKSTHTRRRSTLRDNKAPLLGPRPLESGKRIISDNHFSQHANSQQPPNNSHMYTLNSSQSSLPPSHQLAPPPDVTMPNSQNNISSDFLPSISFDDLHASITGLNDISLSSSLNTSNQSLHSMHRPAMSQQLPSQPAQLQQPPQAHQQPGQPANKVSRSESLVRRFSNARRQGSQSHARGDSANMPPPAAPAARGRRQSAMATSLAQATASNSRPPRKSVGPNFLHNSTGRASPSRDSRVPPSQSQPSLVRSNSINRSSNPSTLIPNGPPASTGQNGARTVRTKSLQPPPRGQSHGNLLLGTDPSASYDPNGDMQATPRPRTQGVQTPSSGNSANRRLSTVYVGGLGARTISPTDARRLKRLSAAAPKNPVPQVPPGPQPELTYQVPRQQAQSPTVVPGKMSTPSSARNTPDFARKGNVQAQALSSNSSFNSLRLSMNMANGPRTSQILAASRLPTPKPRNVHSSAGFVEEEVPPVPAIPKAYESPKDQQQPQPEVSYFARKPVPGSVDEGTPIKQPGVGSWQQPLPQVQPHPPVPFAQPTPPPEAHSRDNRDSRQMTNGRHRRGLTVGSGQEPEKQVSQPNLSKKNLQPLRLPPLNLLPLGSQASSRIASLPPPGEMDMRSAETPPPKRNAKTPSTPMTASKATFFTRSPDEEEFPPLQSFRSSSSHHPIRNDGVEMQDSQYGFSVPIPVPGSRSAASPFSSNSLPKLGDFTHFTATPPVATPVEGTFPQQQFVPMEIDQPLPSPKVVQQLAKESNPSARTSSSDEPGTPASTTSLRRKLSLTWKRSSSKASQRAQEKEDAKAKQTEMPPPKIPASATWSTRNSSDHGSTRGSFDTRTRKVSNTVAQAAQEASARQQQQHAEMAQKAEAVQPPPYQDQRRPAPRSSSNSILTPVQRMLGAKGSLNTLRSRNLDTNLDKDDLAADKVMERLASKRKDFETAAKEVDELRKRAHPKDRVTPSQAMQMVNLNIFERGEIIDFKDVFFCGTRNAKKIIGNADQSATNFGYDDERGDYNIILGDHLAYRYEVVDVLGKGSFGQVVRCIDHKTGGLVAVKIIRNKKRFHQQALVEVNILQKLREWDPDNKHSMINFTQSFYFRGHLCISTELLGINLYEFIKAYDFKGFPLVLIRRFTKQILSSLILLKGKRVIHCDLKPENILLAHPMHSEIKVIDFGSSCFENEKVYTYIQSRFYRSPEVILGMSYGIPIDMWSLGCILAELYSGYPIFPGENEQEQLACIMEIFGPPEKHLIEKSSRKKLFFDSLGKPRVTVSSKGRRRRPSSKTLQSALKCDDDAFLDFLTLCLRWDPDKRLKPEAAMQHEFITGMKRAPQPQGGRPIARAPGNQGPVAHNSPVKRFNAPNPTPQRAQGRDVSNSIRPLPEPPGPNFRAPLPTASPVKAGPSGPRRHSTMTAAPVPGSGPPINGVGSKRVHTTTGAGIKGPPPASGLANAIANGRQQARVMSGRQGGSVSDLASAAAVSSLRGQR